MLSGGQSPAVLPSFLYVPAAVGPVGLRLWGQSTLLPLSIDS